jgi:DNA-binding MarR family transcriptional regulator
VALSAKGELALREVNAALQAVEDEILTGLDHGERTILQGLLARLCHRDAEWAMAQDA